LDGRAGHAARGGGAVHRRRAHRPLPHDCRRSNTHPVRRGGERAIPSRPRRHVPEPRERALRGDVAGAPVARRDGRGALVRRRIGPGAAKALYLPYAYSDFIFSTIGEEWGFLGVLALIVLFGTFAWLGFRIAKSAGDPFGRLLAVGLTGMIGITAVLHIGVTLALLPATGITLPFISYGRSSLFVALVATGVLISIGRGRRAPDA